MSTKSNGQSKRQAKRTKRADASGASGRKRCERSIQKSNGHVNKV
ncbi:MAG: hypothetical protein PHR96_04510 [Clostridia bacterium]|nr:hypothetical protein [Clostridia bacterium]